MNRAISQFVCIPVLWAVAGLSGAAQDKAISGSLRPLSEQQFFRVIRSEMRVDRTSGSQALRSKTFIHPEVLPGLRHAMLFVEETRRDQITRNRPGEPQPGVRVVELRFEKADSVHAEELYKNAGPSAKARKLVATAATASLDLDFWKQGLPASGEKKRFAFDSTDGRFSETMSPDQVAANTPWKISRTGNGQLGLEVTAQAAAGAANASRREYVLRAATPGNFEIHSLWTVSFGTEWSYTFECHIPLPLKSDERTLLEKTLLLTAADSRPLDQAVLTSGMLYLPFPALSLDQREVAGLAVDLARLEQQTLAELMDQIINDSRRFEALVAGGVGNEKALTQFAELESRLMLAMILAEELSHELKNREVLDGLEDAVGQLSSQVFQFPFEFEEMTCLITCAPGRNTVHVTRTDPRWTTGDVRPLQFRRENGQLCFAMQLREEQPLDLTDSQRKGLSSALAQRFGLRRLNEALVHCRLPGGRLTVSEPEPEIGANRLKSLRFRSAAADARGGLRVVIEAAESESFLLIDTCLKSDGLPAAFEIGHLLRGPVSSDATPLRPVSVTALLKTELDFNIVSSSQQTAQVSVIADSAVFDRAASDSVTVHLCYGDEQIRRFKVEVPRSIGEAVLPIPVRTLGDRVDAGLNYSLDGETWKLCEDGLYGLVFVE